MYGSQFRSLDKIAAVTGVWVGRILILQGVIVAVLLLRWPLIPSYLPNFDAANFAFSLTDFNPSEHKPQPPGYPFFVGLARLVHLYVPHEPTVLVLTGVLGTVVGVYALLHLTRRVAGWPAGVVAAALLLLHPALWSDGILNPVRAFLAAGSAVVALAAWRAWEEHSHFGWLVGAFVACGVVSGFRPGLAALLLPLLLAAGIRRRTTGRQWALCAMGLLLVAGGWIAVCARSSGGPLAYLELLISYMQEQSANSSLLYGAPLLAAAKMAGRAVIWAGAPAIAWLWAAPLPGRTALLDLARRTGVFFLLWMGPPLLMSTLVHSAEPGHILPVVVPLCFAGGCVLAGLSPRRRMAAAAVVACAVSVGLFLWPPARVLRPSSIEAIRVEEWRVRQALSTIEASRGGGPVVVVASAAASAPWRVLSYYLKDTPVVALHSDPGGPPGGSPGYWVVRHGTLESSGVREIELPGCGPIVWFVSAEASVPRAPAGVFERKGAAITGSARPDSEIRFGDYVFRTPPSCGPVSALR